MIRLLPAALVLCTFLVGAAFGSCSAQSQAVTQRQIAPTPNSPIPLFWEMVKNCAGEYRDTTKTLEQVTWMLRSPITYHGDTLQGEWANDTIYLTEGQFDDWVIAHELLHHALNGPSGENPHPLYPFLACGLLVRPGEDSTVPLVMRKLR